MTTMTTITTTGPPEAPEPPGPGRNQTPKDQQETTGRLDGVQDKDQHASGPDMCWQVSETAVVGGTFCVRLALCFAHVLAGFR